jgi:uncharacterized protein involved in exopolysaccharide biosynthesis
MSNTIDERATPHSGRYTAATHNPTVSEEAPVFSLVRLAAELVRKRRSVLGWPMALGILALTVTLLQRPTYTTHASFVAQQSDPSTLSRVSGLAAQFGVSLPQSKSTDTPAFYVDMLTSRPILGALVDSGYKLRGDTTPQQLSLLLDVGNNDSGPRRRELVMRALRSRMIVDADVITGTVHLAVRTHRPDLSAAIARRAMVLVNEFNIRLRQSQAENQASFFDSRLKAARNELDRAEDNLQSFLTANRSFSGDSRLQFERDRLNRELQLHQQMYLGLSQSYEQSRLERLKDVPIISVLEEPDEPAIADRRYALLKSIGAGLFGFICVVGVIVGKQAVRSNPAAREDVQELATAVAEAGPFSRKKQVKHATAGD